MVHSCFFYFRQDLLDFLDFIVSAFLPESKNANPPSAETRHILVDPLAG
jgi:hypothetical protein